MNDKSTEVEHPDWASEDAALMARLAEMFRQEDPPPAVVVELARQSFGLRTVDAELAALVGDSDIDHAAVAVRTGESATSPRLLTFETTDLAVEIEVSGSGRHRRLLGQLLPPDAARIEVRQPSASAPWWVEVDDRGRFAVENVRPGPVRLTCHRPRHRPVVTEWTNLQ